MIPAERPRRDTAVVFCCDARYFPFALFVMRQIVFHCPDRSFDFVVVSSETLTLPPWVTWDLHLFPVGEIPDHAEIGRYDGSIAPVLRLMVPRLLGGRYRRVLYLDCDLFFDGADLGRLIEVNLGPHAIAAALDGPMFRNPDWHAHEFRKAWLPPMPYFNTGVMVIDTAAFLAQDIEARAFAAGRAYPEAVVYTEQSLLNLALRGGMAELAPCWNWQSDFLFPLVPVTYPVFITHFVGHTKPDRDPKGLMPARFRHAYSEFFRSHYPDRVARLPPPVPSAPMALGALAHLARRHIRARRHLATALARHRDPWDVKL